ncbi:hypothetical protein NNJEOMEG_03480 [Fundidesulfovibrio magnetotacticus]|uniref:Probable membrane transporter protein n=1 Tax=Fundidesulfovibrio magnetotacticus TaxID=2730080 RepID=A0A6V8LT18_9BACT|nr:sulfite exporter TauE/SafE family protein [Fundidesulfovibrio magnetotacticus]GFK95612.1 hypothetical protein NNJEOMEG_03480 [Fundidesulfovibrio magnetotacticus]
MYFPAAGIEVNPLVPPLVALVISFVTSMGGVSGAFLLLPFQMSVLGYVNPSVSSTNQLYNIVAIPSGVWRFVREGRMVWPLTWVVVLGTLPGVLIGAVVRVTWLPDPGSFKAFAAFVLLYVGGRMAWDLWKRKAPAKPAPTAQDPKAKADCQGPKGAGLVHVTAFTLSRLAYEFQGESYCVKTTGIFGLSFLVGIVGGIYGIGGGAIIAPFFVAFYGLPVHTVAGAALMGTFVTSVAGVAFYQAIAPFYPNLSVAPDYTLGVLFGLGGMCGMYLGARCQKHVPAKLIKGMLAVLIVLLALRYLKEALF